MNPRITNAVRVAAAVVMLGLAGWFARGFFRDQGGVSEKAFYYDLSERRLFVADRGLIPPIRGVNDAVEDGVRAVVISRAGRPADKATWEIAYLERYTPELKAEMEAARTVGGSPAMGRTAAQAHRLVRRVREEGWYSLASPDGERIVSEWATPGPDGLSPAVVAP